MIIVSSCLLGIKAKYDGSSNYQEKLISLCPTGQIIPVCPEQLGGSPTPRPPAEINGGTGSDVLTGKAKVFTNTGENITDLFIDGANEVLRICRMFRVKGAILKERSPSCGCNLIYDGTFCQVKIPGRGVTAALLNSEGIPVYSEDELTDELFDELFCLGEEKDWGVAQNRSSS